MADVLLPGLIKIGDWLIQLFDIGLKRRKEILDDILEPVFKELIIVHKNYVSIFRAAIDALPDLESARRIISEKREEFESERYAVREKSRRYFVGLKHPEERRFVWAVLMYFFEGPVNLDDAVVDINIATLIERGHDAAIDSPTTIALKRLRHETDPGRAYTPLAEELVRLEERHCYVCRKFADLQIRVKAG